ncbi:MAG: hypothetical protein JXB03_00435 [Spirochaetales bacterium]|nr:hypothetical protein [Spirochaetales bacterium]
MKVTPALEVLQGDEPAGNTLRIHPNDGFELGLMEYVYEMKIFNNCCAQDFNNETGDFFMGRIEQANECPLGTLMVNYRMFKKLNMPVKVKLVASNDKILLLNLDALPGNGKTRPSQ